MGGVCGRVGIRRRGGASSHDTSWYGSFKERRLECRHIRGSGSRLRRGEIEGRTINKTCSIPWKYKIPDTRTSYSNNTVLCIVCDLKSTLLGLDGDIVQQGAGKARQRRTHGGRSRHITPNENRKDEPEEPRWQVPCVLAVLWTEPRRIR